MGVTSDQSLFLPLSFKFPSNQTQIHEIQACNATQRNATQRNATRQQISIDLTNDISNLVQIFTYIWKGGERVCVPDIRAAVAHRRADLIVGKRSGGARSDDAFASAGEKVGIADLSEWISVVFVDGRLG